MVSRNLFPLWNPRNRPTIWQMDGLPRQPVTYLTRPFGVGFGGFRELRRINLLAGGSSADRPTCVGKDGAVATPCSLELFFETGQCRNRGRHWHRPSIIFERGGRGPRTPGEIDGATQFSDLSARCGQFQALAFPRSEPCRSRCPVLAGLVRARTSDDIRPRAACTPPPKSLAPVLPGLATQQGCHAHHVWSALFRALNILRGR